MAKYILIGEDDKFFAKLIKSKLDKAGYEVIVAENGEEVLKKAHTKKPDLILLDLIMPIKNGFETLTALKADKDLKDIKVYITSTLSQKEDKDKTMALGANGHIDKESLQDLVSNVEKALK